MLAFEEDGWGRADLPFDDEPPRWQGATAVEARDPEYLASFCTLAASLGADRRRFPDWLVPEFRAEMPYDVLLDIHRLLR
jgi:hypothetical protein